MGKEYHRFFEKEQPELVKIKGGELRLFREGQRLAVSKPSWENKDGVQMGKTVTVDLAANKGNQEIIAMLQNVIAMLQMDDSAKDK